MREVVIVDGVRTAIAKAGENSWFANVRADELGATCLKELVKRNSLDPKIIEDMVWGASYQVKEQGFDLARMTSLISGLSLDIPGTTVERFCNSGLQAIQFAVASIQAGWGDCMVAGGTQHMSHIPMNYLKQINPKLKDYMDVNATNMGWTAEFLAREKKISRQEQDEWSVWSHQKAAQATKEGKFKNEIVPIEAEVLQKDWRMVRMVVDCDQGIRENANMESMAKLKPLFADDELASVTAGNSSQMNDASAAVLIMTKEKAMQLGLKPRLKMLSYAVTGIDPRYTMLGPALSIPKALARAGLKVKDIDVWEVNEAFAVQSVYCQREVGYPKERVNMWGSGISLGHPLACTGARLTTTLMNVMDDVDGKYGVVSMCAAMGHGAAAVFERLK